MPNALTVLNEIAVQRLLDGGSRSLLYRDIDGFVRTIPISDIRLTSLLEDALTVASLLNSVEK